MRGQRVYFHIVLFVAAIVFVGCGEDELLTDLQGEVSDLQSEISILSIKAESAGKENERLMDEIDELQKQVDELSSADYVDPEDVIQLKEKIDQLVSDVLNNGEGISQLDTRATTLDSELNATTVLISEIRSQTDELDLQVSEVIDGRVITAEEIRLVDSTGRLGAKFYGSPLGDPLLFFYDENGTSKIMFGTVSGEPILKMDDVDDNARVRLGVDSYGGFLATYNEDGEITALIREGSLGFYDENSEIGSRLTNSFLELYDEDGEVTTTLDDSGLDTFSLDAFSLDAFSLDAFSLDAFVIYQEFIGIYDENGDRGYMYVLTLGGKPTLIYEDAEGQSWTVPLEAALESQGSGFLLSESGLVVTNHHVIEGRSNIEVVFPQVAKAVTAEVVRQDEDNDLAILKLINFTYSDISDTHIPYQIVSSDSVKAGENTFTLGFPLAYTLGESARVSEGIVNAAYGIDNEPTVFQISNPIQPGNSGGPLFNDDGELIGIVVSSLDAKYFYENADFIPQNVNFAIKSDYLSDLISALSEDEVNEVIYRSNQLAGLSLEEQIEMLTPFMVVVKAR